jgi:tetratricopeptide (TPR) repeat protein
VERVQEATNVSAQAALSEALLAESEQRWNDCFNLCQEILKAAPNNPNALNLLGRVYSANGDAATAIGMQCLVLRLAPNHANAARDLVTARTAVHSTDEADRLYERALALEPDIAYHHRPLGAPQPFAGMDHVEGVIRAALDLDPSHSRAHASLGNILSRRGNRSAAISAYALAAMLDWDYADAHVALAEFYDAADKSDLAAQHLHAALARKALYRVHAPHAVRRVLLLKAPGIYPANALLDFCIDHNRTDLDVFYLTPQLAALPDLADTDIIFNAIGETEEHERAISLCLDLLASVHKPVINHPRYLQRVRRSALSTTLRDVPGCRTLPTLRLSRQIVATAAGSNQELFAAELPLLIRPVDTHRGDGLELICSPAEFDAYLERHPAEHYHVTPFVHYQSPDGYYRKYRVIVVAGVPFAYHLAISEHWLVHYWRVTTLMRDNAWMRDEEERFLRRPEAVFPKWETVFRGVADAIGLDYFGVDCTVTGNGDVLIFECDPSSFVHCRDAADDVFAYKYSYVPHIFSAIDDLLDGRAKHDLS